MPYLTFTIAQKPESKEKDKNKDLSDTYHQKTTQNNNRNGVSNRDAKNDWKIFHESRTLDQFYYLSLENTSKRDDDQVVTRYIDKVPLEYMSLDLRNEKHILRVDQLWLWVIDESKFCFGRWKTSN
jgi:hypothetical protein